MRAAPGCRKPTRVADRSVRGYRQCLARTGVDDRADLIVPALTVAASNVMLAMNE